MYIYIYIYTYTHAGRDVACPFAREGCRLAPLHIHIYIYIYIYICVYIYYIYIYIHIYIYTQDASLRALLEERDAALRALEEAKVEGEKLKMALDIADEALQVIVGVCMYVCMYVFICSARHCGRSVTDNCGYVHVCVYVCMYLYAALDIADEALQVIAGVCMYVCMYVCIYMQHWTLRMKRCR
jgi:hypothetical protein